MENKEKTISVSLFEKNARLLNKKNLKRSILTMTKHTNEYLASLPLGIINECVMEVNVDKSGVDDVLNLLKNKGYRIVGTENLVPIEITLANLNTVENKNEKLVELLEKTEADYQKMLSQNKEYVVDDVEDAKFIISPKKEGISNVLDFIQDVNTELKNIATAKDITILIYVTNTLKNLTGAIAYNFVDEDSNENEVVDFHTSFIISANLNNALSTYLAGFAANSLCSDSNDFDFLNLTINATNAKYTEE